MRRLITPIGCVREGRLVLIRTTWKYRIAYRFEDEYGRDEPHESFLRKSCDISLNCCSIKCNQDEQNDSCPDRDPKTKTQEVPFLFPTQMHEMAR